MENSKIEWTATYKDDGTVLHGYTFNPWIGCTRVSPGCQHCYAETMMDKRYGKVEWGPQGQRIRTSAAYWKQPLKWNRQAAAEGVRRRVFCASLADVFEDKPDQPELAEWRRDLFNLISETSNLDWLLLTKRPENVMQHLINAGRGFQPLPTWVWLGVSVESQEYADKRIPELLKIPAAVRFLSVEPLLGPANLSQWLSRTGSQDYFTGFYDGDVVGVDWVIVGGESGPGARPMRLEWVRDIVRQCQDAGVPPFVKQLGSKPAGEWGQVNHPFFAGHWQLADRKGGDWSEWPDDLRIREFPHAS